MRLFVLTICLVFSALIIVKSDAGKEVIFTENAPKPIGPYSQAILANNTLYISGQIAINPQSGSMDNSDIEKETEQVMANLQAVLNKAGLDFSNVVKTTIYLKEISDFQKVNSIYSKYFKSSPPARETVQVSKLPKEANIEISMIAVKM
ncbi:MAG: RidA family protein [Candidatus Kapabacteria bacterium]|nr:RidA family protein [Candidatus Kapabacteria bacterium]